MQIHYDIPAADYHADKTRISKHGLDLVHRAPMLLNHARSTDPRPPTPTQLLGTLVHLAVLEPERFSATVSLKSKTSEAEHQITEAMMADVCGMAANARRVAGSLFEGSTNEATIHWTATGVPAKCRPDAIKGDVIIDLKTTTDASFEAFQRDAVKFRYHVQAAFYIDALRAGCEPADTFAFVAVEKSAPYMATVFVADDAFIDAGRRQYLEDLETYRECMASGVWPALPREQTLTLPNWYRK